MRGILVPRPGMKTLAPLPWQYGLLLTWWHWTTEEAPPFSPLNCTCVREEPRAVGYGGGRSLETPTPGYLTKH